jgi:hypothetical protein
MEEKTELKEEDLRQYKCIFETLDKRKEAFNEKREIFYSENKGLMESIASANEKLEELKSNLKKAAISEFINTSNKKLLGGIGIRVRSVLEYDESTALSWAKLHSVAVVLDKKAFENIAKDSKDIELGFVTKKEVPTVTFPKEIKLEGD